MAEIDLETKFPDLRPIQKPPSLFTVNGCGLALYGVRDSDAETGTYIKTQCLTFIYLPLCALGAYRVVDAEDGGWYFIGKEPLSGFARIMNAMVTACLIGAIGIGFWVYRINSPDYIAAKKLERADESAANEEWKKAAAGYVEVMETATPSADKAKQRLETLVEQSTKKAPPDAVLAVLVVGESLKLKGVRLQGLHRNAVNAAERFQKSDPRSAFDIIKLVERLTSDPLETNRPDPKQFAALKKSILLALVKTEPDDLEAVSALAVIFEREGKTAECKTLLEPRAAALRDTEGARILGQIYARGGDIEKAHRLLVPYCKQRLEQLHAAEKSYNTRADAAFQSYRNEVNAALKQQNPAGPHADFVRRFRAAGRKQAAQQIGDQYLASLMRKDEELNRANAELRQLSRIVPVALDLGMVQLRRGQRERDPEKRKAELKKAEETFLAIRGIAGQSARYQLYLGQVYYWLGRQKDGRKLFDDLIAGQKRSSQILMRIGSVLRGLGAKGEARQLADEAFRTATVDQERFDAASVRALLFLDLDDKIVWLKRCDPKHPKTRADLKTAEGEKAALDGDDATALSKYRAAAELYGRMPENSVTLNDGAIAWLRIFALTGNPTDFDTAARRIEKAVSLSPTNAILVGNSAAVLHSGAMQAIVGKSLELSKLQIPAGTGALSFLYRNQQQRQVWIDKIRGHSGIKKALTYFKNASVLSPKSSTHYSFMLGIHSFLRDTAAMEELLQRLKTANVDTSGSTRTMRDAVKGKDAQKSIAQRNVTIQRLRKGIAGLKSKNGPTSALGMSSIAGVMAGQWNLGENVDADEVVRLCETAHKNSPSAGTAGALRNAYLFRGLMTAIKMDAQLRTRIESFRRVFSAGYLVAATLKNDAAAAKRLRGNDDVNKAIALIDEANRRFPGSVTAYEWALLSGFDPSRAASLADEVRKNRRGILSTEINRRLSPASPVVALDKYWLLKIKGSDAEATKLVAEMKKLGIPLPVEK